MARLGFGFIPLVPWTRRLVHILEMAGNLTALPLEGLSFPGRVNVSYLKLLAALAAVPAVAIILNVLNQLVCSLPPGGIYLTCRLLVSASR